MGQKTKGAKLFFFFGGGGGGKSPVTIVQCSLVGGNKLSAFCIKPSRSLGTSVSYSQVMIQQKAEPDRESEPR